MIRHVVMFTWADHVDADAIAATSAALDRLPALIPEIRDYRHGSDLGLADGNADYVVVGQFDTVDDYAVYRDHPDHQQMIRDHIAGNVVQRLAIQYEIDA